MSRVWAPPAPPSRGTSSLCVPTCPRRALSTPSGDWLADLSVGLLSVGSAPHRHDACTSANCIDSYWWINWGHRSQTNCNHRSWCSLWSTPPHHTQRQLRPWAAQSLWSDIWGSSFLTDWKSTYPALPGPILFSWAPKSLQAVTVAMKLKDSCSLEGKLWQTETVY